MLIPDWNSLESVRHTHSELEGFALVFFALLVLFDVLAHFSEEKRREKLLEKIGLCFFAVAVFAEIAAYPYGQRNDVLSEQIIGSLDTKAREAFTNASNALTKAGKAESKSDATAREADSLKKDIVSTKKQAADLQLSIAGSLERTKRLEGELTWRSVSPQQIELMKRYFCQSRFRRLMPFLGKKVAFSYTNGDAEAGEYAEELAAALRSTLGRIGADILEPNSVSIYGTGQVPTGVTLETKDTKDSLALELQKGLRLSGVDAEGELTQNTKGGDVDVFVLQKPKGFTAKSSAEISKELASFQACGN